MRHLFPDDNEGTVIKVVNFSALFSLCTSTPAASMQSCEIEMNEVLRLCENSFDLQTYGKQMSLFVTQGDSLRYHLLPQFYHPVPSPPPLPTSLPPCLPTSFLPRRSLSASQHIPRAGSLIRASSTLPLSFLPLSLSPARSLCFLSAARSLSIRHSRTEAVSITYRQVQVQRWHSLTLLRPVSSTQWSRRSREGKGRKKKCVWWVTSLARRRRCQV